MAEANNGAFNEVWFTADHLVRLTDDIVQFVTRANERRHPDRHHPDEARPLPRDRRLPPLTSLHLTAGTDRPG